MEVTPTYFFIEKDQIKEGTEKNHSKIGTVAKRALKEKDLAYQQLVGIEDALRKNIQEKVTKTPRRIRGIVQRFFHFYYKKELTGLRKFQEEILHKNIEQGDIEFFLTITPPWKSLSQQARKNLAIFIEGRLATFKGGERLGEQQRLAKEVARGNLNPFMDYFENCQHVLQFFSSTCTEAGESFKPFELLPKDTTTLAAIKDLPIDMRIARLTDWFREVQSKPQTPYQRWLEALIKMVSKSIRIESAQSLCQIPGFQATQEQHHSLLLIPHTILKSETETRVLVEYKREILQYTIDKESISPIPPTNTYARLVLAKMLFDNREVNALAQLFTAATLQEVPETGRQILKDLVAASVIDPTLVAVQLRAICLLKKLSEPISDEAVSPIKVKFLADPSTLIILTQEEKKTLKIPVQKEKTREPQKKQTDEKLSEKPPQPQLAAEDKKRVETFQGHFPAREGKKEAYSSYERYVDALGRSLGWGKTQKQVDTYYKLETLIRTDPVQTIKKQVNSELQHVQETTDKALLTLFGMLHVPNKPLPSLSLLLVQYARSSLEEYLKTYDPEISDTKIATIQKQLHNYLLAEQERQKLSRVAREITDPLDEKGKKRLISLLRATRQYDEREYPYLQVFEIFIDSFLREEQVRTLQNYQDLDKDVLSQLLMGGGKTFALLPLIALMRADGRHVSTIMLPESLLPSVYVKMVERLGGDFDQIVKKFPTVTQETTLAKLQALQEEIEVVKTGRGCFMISPDQKHSLLNTLSLLLETADEPSKAKLPVLAGIIKELDTNELVIGDEADDLLKLNLQYIMSLGEPVRFPEEESALIGSVFVKAQTLLRDKKIILPFMTKEGEQSGYLSQESYDTTILPSLAQFCFTELQKPYGDSFPLTQEEVVIYLTQRTHYGECDKLLAKIASTNPKLEDQLAGLRNCLLHILPTSLNEHVGLEFGLSDTPWAIPLTGQANTQFSSPYEVIPKTLQAYAKQGIPPAFLELILKTDREGLQEVVGAITDPQQITHYLQKHPDKYALFLQKFLYPLVETHKISIASDSHNLAGSSHSFSGFTGTLYNADTLPRFEEFSDIGTEAEVLEVFFRKNFATEKTSRTPASLLAKIQQNLQIHAIIDSGGWLPENDPDFNLFAQQIFAMRPDITCVIYHNKEGQEVCLHSDFSVISLAQETALLEKRFTIYGKKHSVGADIPQAPTASCIVTIDKSMIVRDFLQASFRMRQIKDGDQNAILLYDEEVDQMVRSVIDLAPGQQLALDHMIRFLITNQELRIRQDRYPAVHHRMKALATKAIRRNLVDQLAKNQIDTALTFFQKARKVLVTEQVNPWTQYGQIPKKRLKSEKLKGDVQHWTDTLQELGLERIDFTSCYDEAILEDTLDDTESLHAGRQERILEQIEDGQRVQTAQHLTTRLQELRQALTTQRQQLYEEKISVIQAKDQALAQANAALTALPMGIDDHEIKDWMQKITSIQLAKKDPESLQEAQTQRETLQKLSSCLKELKLALEAVQQREQEALSAASTALHNAAADTNPNEHQRQVAKQLLNATKSVESKSQKEALLQARKQIEEMQADGMSLETELKKLQEEAQKGQIALPTSLGAAWEALQQPTELQDATTIGQDRKKLFEQIQQQRAEVERRKEIAAQLVKMGKKFEDLPQEAQFLAETLTALQQAVRDSTQTLESLSEQQKKLSTAMQNATALDALKKDALQSIEKVLSDVKQELERTIQGTNTKPLEDVMQQCKTTKETIQNIRPQNVDDLQQLPAMPAIPAYADAMGQVQASAQHVQLDHLTASFNQNQAVLRSQITAARGIQKDDIIQQLQQAPTTMKGVEEATASLQTMKATFETRVKEHSSTVSRVKEKLAAVTKTLESFHAIQQQAAGEFENLEDTSDQKLAELEKRWSIDEEVAQRLREKASELQSIQELHAKAEQLKQKTPGVATETVEQFLSDLNSREKTVTAWEAHTLDELKKPIEQLSFQERFTKLEQEQQLAWKQLNETIQAVSDEKKAVTRKLEEHRKKAEEVLAGVAAEIDVHEIKDWIQKITSIQLAKKDPESIQEVEAQHKELKHTSDTLQELQPALQAVHAREQEALSAASAALHKAAEDTNPNEYQRQVAKRSLFVVSKVQQKPQKEALLQARQTIQSLKPDEGSLADGMASLRAMAMQRKYPLDQSLTNAWEELEHPRELTDVDTSIKAVTKEREKLLINIIEANLSVMRWSLLWISLQSECTSLILPQKFGETTTQLSEWFPLERQAYATTVEKISQEAMAFKRVVQERIGTTEEARKCLETLKAHIDQADMSRKWIETRVEIAQKLGKLQQELAALPHEAQFQCLSDELAALHQTVKDPQKSVETIEEQLSRLQTAIKNASALVRAKQATLQKLEETQEAVSKNLKETIEGVDKIPLLEVQRQCDKKKAAVQGMIPTTVDALQQLPAMPEIPAYQSAVKEVRESEKALQIDRLTKFLDQQTSPLAEELKKEKEWAVSADLAKDTGVQERFMNELERRKGQIDSFMQEQKALLEEISKAPGITRTARDALEPMTMEASKATQETLKQWRSEFEQSQKEHQANVDAAAQRSIALFTLLKPFEVLQKVVQGEFQKLEAKSDQELTELTQKWSIEDIVAARAKEKAQALQAVEEAKKQARDIPLKETVDFLKELERKEGELNAWAPKSLEELKKPIVIETNQKLGMLKRQFEIFKEIMYEKKKATARERLRQMKIGEPLNDPLIQIIEKELTTATQSNIDEVLKRWTLKNVQDIQRRNSSLNTAQDELLQLDKDIEPIRQSKERLLHQREELKKKILTSTDEEIEKLTADIHQLSAQEAAFKVEFRTRLKQQCEHAEETAKAQDQIAQLLDKPPLGFQAKIQEVRTSFASSKSVKELRTVESELFKIQQEIGVQSIVLQDEISRQLQAGREQLPALHQLAGQLKIPPSEIKQATQADGHLDELLAIEAYRRRLMNFLIAKKKEIREQCDKGSRGLITSKLPSKVVDFILKNLTPTELPTKLDVTELAKELRLYEQRVVAHRELLQQYIAVNQLQGVMEILAIKGDGLTKIILEIEGIITQGTDLEKVNAAHLKQRVETSRGLVLEQMKSVAKEVESTAKKLHDTGVPFSEEALQCFTQFSCQQTQEVALAERLVIIKKWVQAVQDLAERSNQVDGYEARYLGKAFLANLPTTITEEFIHLIQAGTHRVSDLNKQFGLLDRLHSYNRYASEYYLNIPTGSGMKTGPLHFQLSIAPPGSKEQSFATMGEGYRRLSEGYALPPELLQARYIEWHTLVETSVNEVSHAIAQFNIGRIYDSTEEFLSYILQQATPEDVQGYLDFIKSGFKVKTERGKVTLERGKISLSEHQLEVALAVERDFCTLHNLQSEDPRQVAFTAMQLDEDVKKLNEFGFNQRYLKDYDFPSQLIPSPTEQLETYKKRLLHYIFVRQRVAADKRIQSPESPFHRSCLSYK